MNAKSRDDGLFAGLKGGGKTGWVLFFFVVMIAVSLTVSGWDKFMSGVSALGTTKILALCGFSLVHYFIRAFRWHMIVRAGNVPATFRQNVLHFFGGFAMTATPGRLGELVRLRWLRRDTGQPLGQLLPIVFADRAIELVAMVLLISFALLSVNLGTNATWWLLAVAVLLVGIACRPKLLEYILLLTWKAIGGRAPRLFVRLRRMTRRLTPFMRLSLLVPTVSIGVVGWALEGVAFYLLLTWLGASVSLWAAMAIFLVAVLSGALSGLPGGLGGTEASAVALLLIQGVPLETAILATIVIRVTTLWFAVIIGLVVFPFAEARSGSMSQVPVKEPT
ncbi:MAG: lysylphosphatidylglycerol synthase transmembrane domain-containing protein [Paracoccaceae bacterium]